MRKLFRKLFQAKETDLSRRAFAGKVATTAIASTVAGHAVASAATSQTADSGYIDPYAPVSISCNDDEFGFCRLGRDKAESMRAWVDGREVYCSWLDQAKGPLG